MIQCSNFIRNINKNLPSPFAELIRRNSNELTLEVTNKDKRPRPVYFLYAIPCSDSKAELFGPTVTQIELTTAVFKNANLHIYCLKLLGITVELF